MTTIAYKDGVIACDGRITSGDTIFADARDKRQVRGGIWFFLCGEDHAAAAVVNTWPDVEVPCDRWNALVYDGEALWYCGSTDGEVWKCKQPANEPMAMGSGSDHALTAMDLGCTAKQAVKMAAKRDAGTGGKIRTYRIATLE